MRDGWAEAGCYAADCCFVRFNDHTMMKCIGMDDILCINTDRYMSVPVNQVAAAKINCPKIIRIIIITSKVIQRIIVRQVVYVYEMFFHKFIKNLGFEAFIEA